MVEDRAKFTTEVAIDSVTVIFADGRHSTPYIGEDVSTLGFKLIDRPNPLTPMQIVKYIFETQNINPLHRAPNETLAAAAKFGEAYVKTGLFATIEEHPEHFAREVHDKLIVKLKIDYTITVRRQLDA